MPGSEFEGRYGPWALVPGRRWASVPRCKIEALEGHLDGAVTTAMPVVNAVPTVCAAPPGIVNRMDLPFVRGARTIRR